MSRRYRLFCAAFLGLALAIAGGYQGEASAKTGDATHHQTDTYQSVAPSPEPTQAPYRPYPNSEAEACYQAQNHDTADLCAYWRAARAAERANKISYAAVILSGLALIALGITIWQTRGAVSEARRANLIAQRANARATRRALAGAKETAKALDHAETSSTAMGRVADTLEKQAMVVLKTAKISKGIAETQKRVSEMQLRPYISAVIGGGVPQVTGRLKFQGTVNLINNGHTPAQNLRHRISAGIYPNPLPPNIDLLLDGEEVIGGILPPAQMRIISGVVPNNVPESDILNVMRGG